MQADRERNGRSNLLLFDAVLLTSDGGVLATVSRLRRKVANRCSGGKCVSELAFSLQTLPVGCERGSRGESQAVENWRLIDLRRRRDSKAAHVWVDERDCGSIVLENHKDASAGEAAVLL